MIKLATLLIFLLAATGLSNEKKVNMYDIKLYKGKWLWYEGTRECYIIKDKDLSIIKFGGVDKRDWKIELRRIGK